MEFGKLKRLEKGRDPAGAGPGWGVGGLKVTPVFLGTFLEDTAKKFYGFRPFHPKLIKFIVLYFCF